MFGPTQIAESLEGRHYGFHASVVKEIDDPELLGRIRVLCHSAYGDSLSPWVMPCFPFGLGVGTGSVSIPPVDSYVWITFEEGSLESPIYIGGFALTADLGRDSDGTLLEESDSHQNNQSPLPVHAQGLPNGSDLEGCVRNFRNVPPSSFAGQYGKVSTTRTQSGHVIELDDTEGNERIFIHHGASGTYYEIRPDGTICEVTEASKVIYNGGQSSVHSGPSDASYDDEMTEVFGGAYSGTYLSRFAVRFGLDDDSPSVSIDSGIVRAEVNDLTMNVTGSALLSAFSSVDINAGDGVTVTSGGSRTDLSVADHKITALNGYDPTQLSNGIEISSQGGGLSATSSDPTGSISLGIEAFQISNDVVLGNLSLPSATRRSPVAIPLQKEGVVMGSQLQLALSALIGILEVYAGTLSSGGSTPGFGGPNPVLATANVALATELGLWASKYATPLPPRAQPFYASDTVFVSK